MNTLCIKFTSLHYREGASDKVYQVATDPKDDGYIVTFAYGRRGSTLSTGTKIPHIVTLQQAHEIHDNSSPQKSARATSSMVNQRRFIRHPTKKITTAVSAASS
jgi:hypothetical protein